MSESPPSTPVATRRRRPRPPAGLSVEITRLLPWLLIGVGVLLRLIRFLHNRALWGDEAALALNLIHRSPRELLEPLDFDQASPVLFLLAVKGVATLFGYSEFSLRALALLAGLVSLPLFWIVAKRVLAPLGALIALTLFAVSDPLVFYSAEVKQYGIDVTITLLLLVLLLPAVESLELSRARALVLGLTGAAAVWASHPAVFVLAGSAATLLYLALRRCAGITLPTVVPIVVVWMASSIASYLLVLPNTSTVRDELRLSGAGGVAATGGHGGSVVREVASASWDSVAYPLGAAATATGLVAVLVATGFIALGRVKPHVVMALSAPIVFALVAALANRYPWGDRFVLFVVPIVILFIGAGLDELWGLKSRAGPILAGAATAVVLGYPITVAVGGAASPAGIKRQEIKKPLAVLDEHWKPGDTLYVHEIAQYALRYYAECECGVLDDWDKRLRDWDALTEIGPADGQRSGQPALRSRPPQLVIGDGLRPSAAELTEQLTPFRGRSRVWLLFSTTTNKDFLTYLLDGWGHQLASDVTTEAAVYLYDLRGT